MKNKKFEKQKTEWEQYRATILNYTLGLITIWVFGVVSLIIRFEPDYPIKILLVFYVVIILTVGGISVIMWKIKQIDNIKKEWNK